MSQSTGPYGISHSGFVSGPSEYEGIHEVLSLHLSPLCDIGHSIRDALVLSSPCRWKNAGFYAHGTPLRTFMLHKVVTTDPSLTEWGVTQEGRTVKGVGANELCSAHIIYLDLITVWKTLKHFLPCLQGYHVLVRCDNTTAVEHINRQGGMQSPKIHALAHRLLVWSRQHFLSLCAIHVLRILNGAQTSC